MARMKTPATTRRISPGATLAVVCAGVFLASLDQTSVVTALPAIMIDLGVAIDRIDDLAWVVTAYLLGFTVAMPLLGRVGDIYGYRRLYLGAMLLFGAGSALVALSPALGWLVAARVVQAIGGGALVPAAIALASEGLPAVRRPVVFGVIGAAAEAGGVMGPLYGGAIVEWFGWRWVFWSNLPVVGILGVALLAVPEVSRIRARLDLAGGILLAGGLTLLTIGLAQRSLFDAGSPTPFLIMGGGVVSLGALAFVERKAAAPVVNKALFATRNFAAAMTSQLLVGGALILVLVTVPLMTDTVLGRSAFEGGLRLMRFTGAIAVGAVMGGYAARWAGIHVPTLAGLALAAAGCALMSTWDETVADPELSLHLAIGGLGFGFVIAPLVAAAVESASADYRATAAAWITMARLVGMTLGLAALAAWGMGHFQGLASELVFPITAPDESATDYEARLAQFEAGVAQASFTVFRAFFRAAAVLCLVASAPVLWSFLPSKRSRPSGPAN